MQEYSTIQGYFTKILWISEKGDVVICSFKIQKNDVLNHVMTNKFNSISVIFKNNLFNLQEIILDEKIYQIQVLANKFSKYPNSYTAKSISHVKENDNYKVNYIVKFLKSANFRGIGEEKSWAIVNDLGVDAISKIINDDSIDYKKYNISEENWKQAKEFLIENPQLVEDQLLFLKLNLSPSLYEIILKQFLTLNIFIEKYKENFYKFFLENKKVKLDDIDKLSTHFNYPNHPFKKATHVYKAISDYFFSSGNTRIKKNEVHETLAKNISYDPNWPRDKKEFSDSINLLIEDFYLIELNYDGEIFLTTKEIYEMEKYIIERLVAINHKSKLIPIPFKDSRKYHDLQLKAITSALSEKLVLITGSPGTGKTLITNEIINQLLTKYHEKDIAVVTPTGRATININNQQRKLKASTIHSFLEWDPENDRFNVNENYPKNIECLIIDEFSMVSVDIFFSLLKGLNKRYLKKIILVGDKDQLPAIGPGYLINDFIENKIFNTIFLSKIYRQSENYEIIKDAISINSGKWPKFDGKSSQFIETKREKLKEKIKEYIEKLLETGYTKRDIAILSPIYNYDTGIDEINDCISDFYRNLEKQEIIKYREKNYAIDDKIINLTNDPKAKIFNGEIGYISKFTLENKKNSSEKLLTHISVDFEDSEKTVTFSRSDFLANTYPAYCTSVHKYQGSECKAVIIVLFSEAKRLLSKKLIYTAITRAKNYSVILGEKEALIEGIQNDGDSKRITNISKLWNEVK
ncbi:exodeoxyribonuclease V subunit alpha [[Mycoplasma] phocae]|uniref:Exodeoxyribonuclease V subunit alpha n=2 Tax=[Mycoplasma] phocae TaxID=142651 RepID=A0A2Z5IQT9_9BACT|nr:exodeoxyribonuclease V subunit alpha [[Mycoplasma] phocae]